MKPSRELALALDCCRWNFASAAAEPPIEPAPDLDWQRFLRLVRFHRVQGLASKCLCAVEAVPDRVARDLSDNSRSIAAANLAASVECRSLLQRFGDAGEPLLFLKGLTLGALAYGSATAKSAVDIDLLIPAGRLDRAAQLLRERGYNLVIPGGKMPLEQWHSIRKESVWAIAQSDLMIDLHTSLADNPRLIPAVGINSPTQSVDIGNGIALPTLALDELFAYLAVHGASSAWFRLKWISDFAGLLAGRGGEEIDRLYRRSQELGAGRAPAQALLLADRLFGTLERNARLKAELSSDRASRWLFEAALRQAAAREPAEPTSTRLGTLAIHWTQLLLLPGARFKLSEIARQARAALP